MPDSLHRILIAAVIFMYSNSFVQNGLLPLPVRYVNFVAMVITALLVLSNWRECLRLTWRAKGILLLTLLAVASTLWSIAPNITLRRSFILAGSIGLGIYIASRYTLKEQVIFYSRVLIFAGVASIMVAILFPTYGIHQDAFHDGRLRGITHHKNVLGEWLSLATLIFLFMPATMLAMSRNTKYLIATITIILLALTVSLTSAIAALMVTSIYPVLAVLRWDFRLRGAIILYFLATLIVGITFTTVYYVEILALLGRTPTLSGRSTIWPVVVSLIGERPLLGYGYLTFFVPESSLIESAFRDIWRPEHAHNVWLDLGMDFGLTGIFLFIYITLRSLQQTYTMYVVHRRAEVLLIALLILNILARSMTETLAIWRRDLIWIMFISLIVALREEYRHRSH